MSDSSPLSPTVGTLVTMMRVAGGCCLVDEESQIMLRRPPRAPLAMKTALSMTRTFHVYAARRGMYRQ